MHKNGQLRFTVILFILIYIHYANIIYLLILLILISMLVKMKDIFYKQNVNNQKNAFSILIHVYYSRVNNALFVCFLAFLSFYNYSYNLSCIYVTIFVIFLFVDSLIFLFVYNSP